MLLLEQCHFYIFIFFTYCLVLSCSDPQPSCLIKVMLSWAAHWTLPDFFFSLFANFSSRYPKSCRFKCRNVKLTTGLLMCYVLSAYCLQLQPETCHLYPVNIMNNIPRVEHKNSDCTPIWCKEYTELILAPTSNTFTSAKLHLTSTLGLSALAIVANMSQNSWKAQKP